MTYCKCKCVELTEIVVYGNKILIFMNNFLTRTSQLTLLFLNNFKACPIRIRHIYHLKEKNTTFQNMYNRPAYPTREKVS